MSQTVKLTVTADSSQAVQALSNVSSQLSSFSRQVSNIGKKLESSTNQIAKKISTKLVAMGNIIANIATKAFGLLTSQLDNAVKRFDILNNFSTMMANLGQDAQKSADMINYMAEYLTGLPTRLDDAASAVQRFTAANKNVEASTAIYLALNDAILAGNAPMEKQVAAMSNLTNAYATGKFTAYQYRAVIEAMPAQLQQVAESLGYTSSAMGGDFYNAMTNGTISMNDFMKEVVRLDKEGGASFESFAEQAKNATAGVQTAWANLQNAFTKMGAGILQSLKDNGAGIAEILNRLTVIIKRITLYAQALATVVARALNAVLGFMGTTKKTGDQASKTTATLSDNVGSASDNMADATKNAKKLQNQLGAFDEMNVLKESSGSLSGALADAGAGVGGITLDMSGVDASVNGTVDDIIAKFEGIQPILEKLFKNIASDWERVWKQVKKVDFTTLTSTLANVARIANSIFTGILEGFTRFYNGIAPGLNKITEVLADVIPRAIQRIQPHISRIAEILNPILEAVARGLKKIGDAFVNSINPVLSGVERGLQNLRPTIITIIDKVSSGITYIINKMATWDWGKITAWAGKLLPIILGFKAGTSIFGSLGTAVSNVASKFSLIKGAADKVGSAFNIVAGIGRSVFEGTLPEALEGLSARGKLGDFAATIINTVAHPIESLKGVFANFGGIVKGVWGIISAHPLAAVAVAVGVLFVTSEDFRKMLGDFIKVIEKLVKEVGKALMPVLESLMNLGKQLISVLLKPILSLIQSLMPAIQSIMGVVVKVITVIAQAIIELMPFIQMVIDIIAEIAQYVGELLAEIAPVVGEIISALVEMLIPAIEMVIDIISQVVKVVKPILQLVISVVKPIIELIMNVVKSIVDFLLPIIKEIINFIKGVIAVVTEVIKVVVDIISKIIEAVVNFVQKIVEFFQNLWNNITGIFEGVGNWFKDAFGKARDAVVNVFQGIGQWFGDRWNDIKNVFSKVGDWFKGIFEGAWNNIKNVFSKVGEFFQNIWNTITGVFSRVGTAIGEAVSGAFKNVVNGVLSFIEGFINKPINLINGFIGFINDAFGFIGVNIGKIPNVRLPRMAKGGIVDQATIAMIGENGKEAVVPLENNTEWLDTLVDKLVDSGIGSGEIAQPIIVKIGEDTILDTIIEKAKDKSYIRNRNVMAV